MLSGQVFNYASYFIYHNLLLFPPDHAFRKQIQVNHCLLLRNSHSFNTFKLFYCLLFYEFITNGLHRMWVLLFLRKYTSPIAQILDISSYSNLTIYDIFL